METLYWVVAGVVVVGLVVYYFFFQKKSPGSKPVESEEKPETTFPSEGE